MGRGVRVQGVLLGVLLALGSTACGSDLMTPAGPTPSPYPGPLWVAPDPHLDLWEDPGAAARVTDCDFDEVGGTSTNPYTGGEVGSSPEDALREAQDEGVWDGLVETMSRVREDADRVLFAYTSGGRVKQAVIVHEGPAAPGKGAGSDGIAWWVESWARCDVAEYPPEVAERLGLEVWSDAGGRVPIRTVVSYPGGDCVPGTHFLELGRGTDDTGQNPVYVAHGEAWPDHFAEPYRSGVALPPDAVDSGYHRDGDHLWFSADRRRAYVGDGDRVELWPRTTQPLACA